MGRAELSDEEVATLQAVLVDTGARAEIEDSIERLTAQAIMAAEQAPVTDEAQRALVDLAHYVAERER